MFELVGENIYVFQTAISAGPPARIKPLKIELALSAASIKVRLLNCSRDQRSSLPESVGELVRNDMAYANFNPPCACALLLVPKPGPEILKYFTVDLRPVNMFTVNSCSQWQTWNSSSRNCETQGTTKHLICHNATCSSIWMRLRTLSSLLSH